MEVILYYDKQGKKQWVIARGGNSVIENLIPFGYVEDDFLILDITVPPDKDEKWLFDF